MLNTYRRNKVYWVSYGRVIFIELLNIPNANLTIPSAAGSFDWFTL